MAKECIKKPPLENVCSSYSGGQCEGVGYVISWAWNLTLSGFGDRDGTFPQNINTGFLIPQYQWIKGKLGCISKPLMFESVTERFINVGYNHTVEYSDSDGNGFIRTFGIAFARSSPYFGDSSTISDLNLVGVSRVDGLPDSCGNRDHDEYDCTCSGSDETVSCDGARGKICCIPNTLVQRLCAHG